MKRSFRSGFLQLLVLTVSMAISVVAWIKGSHYMAWQHLLGAALLSVCWTVHILRKDQLWLVMLFTLFAAGLCVAMFLPERSWMSFALGIGRAEFKIGFHPLFGPLFIGSLWVWRDRVRAWFRGSAPDPLEQQRMQRARVDSYKRNLSQFSSADLQQKLRDPLGLVPDARIAVQELLRERGTT